MLYSIQCSVCGYRKFCQRGSNSYNCFFLVDEELEDPNTTKSRPIIAYQRNAISLASRWWPYLKCWLGSLVIFKGIRTSIAKKPYIFVIFQGGPDPPPPGLATKTQATLSLLFSYPSTHETTLEHIYSSSEQ